MKCESLYSFLRSTLLYIHFVTPSSQLLYFEACFILSSSVSAGTTRQIFPFQGKSTYSRSSIAREIALFCVSSSKQIFMTKSPSLYTMFAAFSMNFQRKLKSDSLRVEFFFLSLIFSFQTRRIPETRAF